jgi:hypothetical protein
VNKQPRVVAVLVAALITLYASTASAMTIREFRKFSPDERSMYIGAAVNMLAYTYAASGNVPKATCIKNWYFGKSGVETPGPREITIELGVAEHTDPDKYHVEGVILGVTDKACPVASRK